MFKRKHIKKFIDRAHELYDWKFSHIENVLNSCQTIQQLDRAWLWALAVTKQIEDFEDRRIQKCYGTSLYLLLKLRLICDMFFQHKYDVIDFVYNKMCRKLLKINIENNWED